MNLTNESARFLIDIDDLIQQLSDVHIRMLLKVKDKDVPSKARPEVLGQVINLIKADKQKYIDIYKAKNEEYLAAGGKGNIPPLLNIDMPSIEIERLFK